jgi:hypothetical protein
MAHEVKCRHLLAMWELGTVSVSPLPTWSIPTGVGQFSPFCENHWFFILIQNERNPPSSWKEMLFSIPNTQLGYQ